MARLGAALLSITVILGMTTRVPVQTSMRPHLGVDDTAPATTIRAVAPGDTVTRALWLTNRGSTALRYSVHAVGIGDSRLLAATSLRVSLEARECTSEGSAGRGTALLLVGTLAKSSERNPEGRVLAPATRELLCVQERLSPRAGNDVEGLRAHVILTITYDASGPTSDGSTPIGIATTI